MLHNYCDQYQDWEKNLAKAIGDGVNTSFSMRGNAEYLANYEHRYLQNEAFKFFLCYMEELARNYDEGRYDGRNEYACAMSKHIKDLLEENPLIHRYQF